MRVVAVMMVRDEGDIIAYTLEHLLAEQVDEIVIANNRSVDATLPILLEYAQAFPVTVVDDPVIGYWQATKMTNLARDHCAEGDWVVPVDADELWFATDGRPLGDMLRDCGAGICSASPFVHVPSEHDHANDNPFLRIQRRVTHPEQMAKVAFRWSEGAEIEMGNHGVTGVPGNRLDGVIGVRHLQYRSLEQVRRKVTNGVEAYAATPLSEVIGAHWRSLAAMDGPALQAWWDEYIAQATVLDPAPWSQMVRLS